MHSAWLHDFVQYIPMEAVWIAIWLLRVRKKAPELLHRKRISDLLDFLGDAQAPKTGIELAVIPFYYLALILPDPASPFRLVNPWEAGRWALFDFCLFLALLVISRNMKKPPKDRKRDKIKQTERKRPPLHGSAFPAPA